MNKIFRLIAIGVFAIAATATFTAPKATASTISFEGSAPVPLCMPDDKACKPW
jgi:hypothetical protein